MFRITKRGSLTVEAAILLPMVILGILTLAFLIKVNSTNESVMSACTDEARLLNIESYMDAGKINALAFPRKLTDRLQVENAHCEDFHVENFRYLYPGKGMDKLVSFNVNYQMKHGFAIDFYGNFYGSERVVSRAFLGNDNYRVQRGFAPMEEEEKSEPVWIFPASGKRYHKENCTYVKAAAVKACLNSDIKRKYRPCKLCESKEIKTGSIVYCFVNSGNSYHSPDCSTIDKYVVKTEKKDAINKGYTPCLKCGGA